MGDYMVITCKNEHESCKLNEWSGFGVASLKIIKKLNQKIRLSCKSPWIS